MQAPSDFSFTGFAFSYLDVRTLCRLWKATEEGVTNKN